MEFFHIVSMKLTGGTVAAWLSHQELAVDVHPPSFERSQAWLPKKNTPVGGAEIPNSSAMK
jgi:hypothetical protein